MRRTRDRSRTGKLIISLSSSTPIVNDEFLQHIRQGKVSYRRGDVVKITRQGVQFNERKRGTKSGDPGEESMLSADAYVQTAAWDCRNGRNRDA